MGLYGPYTDTGNSVMSQMLTQLSILIDNLLAGATPANGSVTDAKVAANAAIAQSKIANLVADLAARATDAELAAGLATKQDTIPPGTYPRTTTLSPNAKSPAFGALGDGVADDTAGLQAMLDALAENEEGYVPAGVYNISATLVLPLTASLRLDPGAQILATATIAGPMLSCGTTSARWTDGKVRGGVWNCNHLARNGIKVARHLTVGVSDLKVINATQHPIIVGDGTTNGNEMIMRNVKTDTDAAVVAGYYGIHVNAYDGHYEDIVVVGSETSFRVDKDANKLVNCHGWGYPGQLPIVIFDNNGFDNEFMLCKADSPSAYGYRMRTIGWRIAGGEVMNGPSGVTGVVGIHTDQGYPTASIVGVAFNGTSGAPLLTDYDGPLPNEYLIAVGCTGFNVVNPVVSTKESLRNPMVFGTMREEGARAIYGGAATAAGATQANAFTINDIAMATFFPGRPYLLEVLARDTATGTRSTALCEILVSSEASVTATLCSVDNKLGAAFGLGAGVGTYGVSVAVDATGLVLTASVKNNSANGVQFGFRLRA